MFLCNEQKRGRKKRPAVFAKQKREGERARNEMEMNRERSRERSWRERARVVRFEQCAEKFEEREREKEICLAGFTLPGL